MMSESPSFLSVVLDIESLIAPLSRKQKSETEVNAIIQQVIIFCTAYSLAHRENRLLLLGYHNGGTEVYFPRNPSSATNELDFIPSIPTLADSLTTAIGLDLLNIQNRAASTSSSGKSLLSSALSTSLSVIHRLQQTQSGTLQNRILAIQFDRDRPQNYNSVMNCIFSAQKMNVIIDSYVVSSFDSLLMQQTSFLTNGIYFKNGEWSEFLSTLQLQFFADNQSRRCLLLPTQTTVDFKASCYCCKQPVEFAYMCSVCLTLLCKPPDIACPVCETQVRQEGSTLS